MAINNNESKKKARNKIPQFKITLLYPNAGTSIKG
jgi:hypothetical protein